MKKIFGLTILIALFSLDALADVAPPPKPRQVDAKIGIIIDKDTKEPTLSIPREMIAELARQQGVEGAPVGANLSSGQTQTLVSGLFLSLALVFGGVWFARSKKLAPSSRIALVAAVLAILGVGGSVALGNIAPPLYYKITSKIFSKGIQNGNGTYGSIKVEVSETASKEYIRLTVPVEKKDKGNNKEEE